MSDEEFVAAIAKVISDNWQWILITVGSGFTAMLAFAYRVCRSLVDWAKPKFENVYAKHMELVENLKTASINMTVLLQDVAVRIEKIERTQEESGKRLADVHRLIMADEDWDEESKKEKHVNK